MSLKAIFDFLWGANTNTISKLPNEANFSTFLKNLDLGQNEAKRVLVQLVCNNFFDITTELRLQYYCTIKMRLLTSYVRLSVAIHNNLFSGIYNHRSVQLHEVHIGRYTSSCESYCRGKYDGKNQTMCCGWKGRHGRTLFNEIRKDEQGNSLSHRISKHRLKG